MNVAVIYGTERKGSTYNITQLFLKKLNIETQDVTEFFLPKDMPHFCIGCGNCFMKGEKFCPHYADVNIIKKAMLKSDLLIFASPVYVYHATGQMKTLLDHFAYQWMVHRPEKKMFSKMALVISTAAGGGMKSTNKDIVDSLSFWGVGRIFKYGKGVAAINWEGVSGKNKINIEKDVEKLATKILNTSKPVTPCIRIKTKFYFMRFLHKKIGFSDADINYWNEQGWLEKERPW
jgi:multimeric flavodoxin WrbA